MSDISNNLRKAAILVASLDQQTADTLLDQMPAEQAALVRRMIVDLGDPDPREERNVIDEFFRVGPSIPAEQPAGIELNKPAPSMTTYQPTPASTSLRMPRDSMPFRFLHEASSEKLNPILAAEHPQTIALVVSHLPADQAAEVLGTLEGSLQTEVVRRLVDLDEANPEILREVERGLESRIFEQGRDDRRRAAGLIAVSGILAAADASVKREILANLSRHDRALASKLTRQKFEFAHLEELNDQALAAVLEAADSQIIVLAVAGAPTMFVERVLNLLPATAARLIRRELEALGPLRLSDIEEAQRELSRIARYLETEGRIDLPRYGRLSVST
jgi:flagellar motor switch protein FliG